MALTGSPACAPTASFETGMTMSAAIATLTDAFEDPSTRRRRDGSRPSRRRDLVAHGADRDHPCRGSAARRDAWATRGDAAGRRTARSRRRFRTGCGNWSRRCSPDGFVTRRASSCRAHRMRTTRPFSTCASWSVATPCRCALRSCCSICCSRTAPTCARTTRRGPAISSRRSRRSGSGSASVDDVRDAIARANAARASMRRLLALRRGAPRVSGCGGAASPRRILATGAGRLRRAGRRGRRRARPPAAARGAPRACWRARRSTGPALHAAIESHGAIVVAEPGPWGSEAAGEDIVSGDDPFAAIAERYRRQRDRSANAARGGAAADATR